ncbi:hypothetical protein TNCV_4384611 [Trichonephila clavipes]|nr:hypothetical protein TNCV_4384611 [Trichonephila clavipes]
MQVTRSPPPILWENTLGWSGSPTSLPLPRTSREDLWLDGYLEYPHAAKAKYIYRYLCLLRDSNPGPTAPQGRGSRVVMVTSSRPALTIGSKPGATEDPCREELMHVKCVVVFAPSSSSR